MCTPTPQTKSVKILEGKTDRTAGGKKTNPVL